MIKCLECMSAKVKFTSDGSVLVNCLNCGVTFVVGGESLAIELERLTDLEKAANELHFVLSNHPTIQRLSAVEDSTVDTALCNFEKYLDFESMVLT